MGMFNRSLNAIKGIGKEFHQTMGAKPMDYAIGAAIGATGNLVMPMWLDKENPYTNATLGAIGGAMAMPMARKFYNSGMGSNLKKSWEKHYK